MMYLIGSSAKRRKSLCRTVVSVRVNSLRFLRVSEEKMSIATTWELDCYNSPLRMMMTDSQVCALVSYDTKRRWSRGMLSLSLYQHSHDCERPFCNADPIEEDFQAIGSTFPPARIVLP